VRLTTSVVCLTSVAYIVNIHNASISTNVIVDVDGLLQTNKQNIVNIHGAHSYWKEGALGAADQA